MDLSTFAKDHVSQITATIGLVTYASARKKLTLGGILSGILVAGVHMLHPWPAFFWLLIIFFLLGTVVTKVRYACPNIIEIETMGMGKLIVLCLLSDRPQVQISPHAIRNRRLRRRRRAYFCTNLCKLWDCVCTDCFACASLE